MEIEIVVNGRTHTTTPRQTVLGLLQELDLDPTRVAVELDRSILKRAHWAETALDTGARLEIVQFVGGG